MRRPSALRLLIALGLVAAAAVGAWRWLGARHDAEEQASADRASRWIEAVFDEAEAARRRGEPVDPAERMRRARERIAAEAAPGVRSAALTALGVQLNAANQAADAEAVLNEAVDLAHAELGDEHARTDAARVQRALFYRAAGRQKEARVEFDALLPRLRKAARSRPRELVAVLQGLALVRGDEGQLQEAVDTAREALAIADARLAVSDPVGAAAALVLARSLQQKQDAAALAAAQDAWRRTELAFPAAAGEAPNPRRIDARSVLGRALAEGAQLERGLAELNRALDETRSLFGRDSLEAAVATQSLVAYQVDRGLLREANLGADEALRILLRVSIRRSYNVGAAFEARGYARLAARRDADARDYLVIATQTLGVMIGHDHPATRLAKVHLAQALLNVEGVALATEAVRDLDAPAAAASDHAAQPFEAAALRVRAVAERLQGRPQASLALLERAATRIAAGHRAESERAALDIERGRALLELGRAAEAKAAFEAALGALRQSGSLPQPSFADAQVGLGRAGLALGDVAGATTALQAADAFWRGFDADNPWATEALFWLVRAMRAAPNAAALVEAEARLAAALNRAPVGSHAVLSAIRATP